MKEFRFIQKNRIEIGDNTRVGWNSQILDTGFHYMINNGVLKYRDSTVFSITMCGWQIVAQ